LADNTQQAPKRRIRPVTSETVRERAEKAQIAAGINKPRRVRGAVGKGMTPVRGVGRGIGFLSRFIIPSYFRNSWKELKLVTWPNRKQSRQLTFAVIVFATIFGILVASVDWGLDKVFKQVLLK
jgi:preprotein translocase SecE subunit